jgi:hypothetical protein
MGKGCKFFGANLWFLLSRGIAYRLGLWPRGKGQS